MRSRSLALACVTALAFGGRRSEAFCGLGAGEDVGHGDFVTCLKAKAITALERVSRADTLPLTGSVTLVRDEETRRRQRSDRGVLPTAHTEHELRSKTDETLDQMLFEKAIGLFSGRVVRIGLPELTPEQLTSTLEEGRGKMKKTMGMMMTLAAMKAMMVIPLALGLLFLMAGKAMIISKIALVLSLIITLKKLISKSGEHVVHETHSSSAAWPPGGSSVGYGGGGGGWDKRSSSSYGTPVGQMLAYSSYKP